MSNVKFTKSHEWARIEEGNAIIGITDYAQHSLGDIVFVELPKAGAKIKQSAQFGTIESTKAASELYAPLSGEVIDINKELMNNPQWINEEPFGKGWMMKIKVTDTKELNNLMDETTYKEFVAKESH